MIVPCWIFSANLLRNQTPAHTFYSGYTAAQLEPLIHTLVECCENPKTHHGAVFDKFSDRRYKRASLYVQNWMNRDMSGDEEEAGEEEEEEEE